MQKIFKNPPPCRAVLFDLDGTVLNTNNLIIQSFKHVFREINGQSIASEAIVACFGEPLRVSLQRLSPDNWEVLLEEYRRFSLLHHDDLTEIFQGAKECLELLRDSRIKLGIVTSKMRSTALKGLDLFELTPFFDGIVGMEDCQQHKPDPDPVIKGCQAVGVNPTEAFMVGDSVFDIKSAKAAGAYAIGVMWSMNNMDLLAEAGADAIVSTFEDLYHLATRQGFKIPTNALPAQD
jgi:pyrophosphatase PpaX